MYYYHGNKHYYLTRIFLNDKTLQEIVYASGVTSDYEQLAYALADNLYDKIENYLLNNDNSAIEFYDSEYSKYKENQDYVSTILMGIQTAIFSVTTNTYPWYYSGNKGLYVEILKSLMYGSIKHFFFENRDKYLPQYDWYLINSNEKRKAIVDMLFKEFDKLTNVADALKYYQDPDDIPLQFLIYLQETAGLSMNTYNGVFNGLQLRSLTKHLMEVWREKGALYSIELFFACMGIDCNIQELWFDRRLYDNTEGYNNYTNEQDPQNFGYYLTPKIPYTVSYKFSTETVNYSMCTSPRSSRVWSNEMNKSLDKSKTLRELLGLDEGAEITYEFFKSNYLLFNFDYINQNKIVSKNELAVYKELINVILPVYIRAYYGNEYGSVYGNENWDILKSYDLNSVDNSNDVTDSDGIERPAEKFRMFDTEVGYMDYRKPETQYELDHRTPGTDYMPVEYDQARTFVSGSYIIVNDTRLTQIKSCDNTAVLQELVTSPEYEVIGGTLEKDTEQHYIVDKKYPVFYDEQYEYLMKDDNTLIRLDGTTDPNNPYVVIGTEGDLVVATRNDITDIFAENTLTRYYFEVNGSSNEIYPTLFVESSDSKAITSEDETFGIDIEPQIDWTYDIPETQDVIEHLPYETFDQEYTNKALNLFESSIWTEDITSYNNLYEGEPGASQFLGEVQYEYCEHTNPVESVEADLKSSITIELI